MPVGTLGDVDESADEAPGEDNSPRRPPVWLVYGIAAAVLIADQAAKFAAVRWLRGTDSVPVTSWLSLTWATNTGGAFGLFDSSTTLLAAVAAVVIVALALIAPRLGPSRLIAVGVGVMMGGAIGNLIDRVRIGYVIDYIDLHFWPVFNIADIAITVGAGLLIIAAFAGHPQPESTGEDSD